MLESAIRLSYITVAWNGSIGAAALVAAAVSGSPALAAFALNALLDSSASVVLVWRFRTERRDPTAAAILERRAQRWIAAAMVAIGLYVGAEAIRALAQSSHPEESVFGLVLTAVSLAFLPWLGGRKLLVASRLSSGALRADGILTLAAATLAGITVAALLINTATSWWWADPVAALVIGAALAVEGIRLSVRRDDLHAPVVPGQEHGNGDDLEASNPHQDD